MKFFYTTLISLSLILHGYAQEADILSGQNLIGKTFTFTTNISAGYSQQYALDSSQVALKKGYIVSVVDVVDGTVYFDYWKFPEGSPNGAVYNDKTFFMPEDRFLVLANRRYPIYKGVEMGAYTIPFRLRGIGGDNFDFESSLSLQANLVFGFGFKENSYSTWDFSAGIGLSSINLNNENSNVVDERTAAALTLSGGLVWKPSQYANIGVFLGWDYLNNVDQSVNWIYNRQAWVGVGVNISFDRIESNKSPDQSDQPTD